MIYGSVCSGIEAATVAWEPLGWKAEFFSEIEKFPCAVLNHHYPSVPNLGDMTRHKEWEHGAIDLLVGGTPCQSFSVAGLRKGLDDPRGNLALVFLSIIDRARPRWVVWENVPGVLSSNGGRDFGAFLGGLAQLGYGFAYRVLDAQFFGVPQRRRRVFVVGHLGDWRPPATVLFERESMSGHPAPRREKGQRVAPCLSQSLKSSGGIGMSNQELFSQGGGGLHFECFENHPNDSRITDSGDLCPTISSRAGTGGGNLPLVMAHGQGNAEVVRDGEPSLTCNHEAPIVIQDGRGMDKAQNGKGYEEGETAYTLDQTGVQAVCYHRNASCAVTEQEGITAALRSQGEHSYQFISFAQNTRDEVRLQGTDGQIGGALGANEGMKQRTYLAGNSIVRRLTPTECERLQGFPDGYTLIPWSRAIYKNGNIVGWSKPIPAPDGPRYKALGNSMAVPVMRWIGRRIEEVDNL